MIAYFAFDLARSGCVSLRAAYWKMDPMEVLALATGEHRLQNQ